MEKQSINKVITTTDSNSAVYEVSYLLLPSIASEQVSSKAEAIKNKFVSLGGQMISHEDPILIDLAYSMTKVVSTIRHKCTSGYFGWMKFEISNGEILEVKKILDIDPEILRYLIIKTVRENTLLNGKMMLKKEEKVKKDLPEEGVEDVLVETSLIQPEVVVEDIDKSIDDLVIV